MLWYQEATSGMIFIITSSTSGALTCSLRLVEFLDSARARSDTRTRQSG